MLRWTPSGAVSTPATVQIRVEDQYPDRLSAGAPQPTRSLHPDELRQNILYFTQKLNTPRTRPCTSLVLSGHGVATRPDVPAAIALGREHGLQWVVLHAGTDELARVSVPWMQGLVDQLVLPVRGDAPLGRLLSLVEACRAHRVGVVFAVELNRDTVPTLPEMATRLAAATPASVAFTWPFPRAGGPAERAPTPGSWEVPLSSAIEALRGTRLVIRGLPTCHVSGHADRFRRTSNRWYVDASHQQQEAMLFLPDVVQFTKSDACRFCSMDDRCDGFFQAYIDHGHPALAPL